MKKQATLFAVLFAATLSSFGHNPGDTLVAEKRTLYGSSTDSMMSRIPAPETMLQQIMQTTGLQADFEIKAADVLNIQASVSRGKRVIHYNPEYIRWINLLTRDKWCTMALLAHEVGHHLNGHTIRKGGSSPKVELEADEFAGFVLFKLGASLENAQKVMNYIAGIEASSTHPGRMSRKQAIQRGWEKAGGTALVNTN